MRKDNMSGGTQADMLQAILNKMNEQKIDMRILLRCNLTISKQNYRERLPPYRLKLRRFFFNVRILFLIYHYQLDSLFVVQSILVSPSCQKLDPPLDASIAECTIINVTNTQRLCPLNRVTKHSKESSSLNVKYSDLESGIDEFIECYYEYKEDGKVFVIGRLKSNIDLSKCIDASYYIIYGYKIPFIFLPQQSVSLNNKSALQEE